MADPLDFGKLLKEISPSTPAGADLHDDATSVYRKVKTAWELARKAERKLRDRLDEKTPEVPDWSPVLKLAPEAIATKSKDLDLAVWLTEALARKNRFEGLLDGLRLIRQLVENYWDRGLHPSPEKYGIEESLRMTAALNGTSEAEGTIIQPINEAPLTEKVDQVGPFSRLDYLNPANLAAIEKVAARTSPPFRKRTLEMVDKCFSEWDALDALLVKKCRGAAPFSGDEIADPAALASRLKEPSDEFAQFLWSKIPESTQQLLSQFVESGSDPESLQKALADEFNRITPGESIYDEKRFAGIELSAEAKELLGKKPSGHALLRLNRMLLEEACDLERPEPSFSTSLVRQALADCQKLLGGGKEKPAAEPANDEQAPAEQGPVQTRQQAFQQLLEIARYFEQTEPHSPISYALKRIVRWGDLPLPQLLAELIRDQGARSEVYKLVGIATDKEKPS